MTSTRFIAKLSTTLLLASSLAGCTLMKVEAPSKPPPPAYDFEMPVLTMTPLLIECDTVSKEGEEQPAQCVVLLSSDFARYVVALQKACEKLGGKSCGVGE
jgi:hypothetical protein